MRRPAALLALTLLLACVSAVELQAGTRGRGWLRWRSNPMQATVPGYQVRSTYRPPYRSAEELYPKYNGAFHYRHLDNIGIPTGDIGIRGNGLYMTPW